jgi:hypothetical protein
VTKKNAGLPHRMMADTVSSHEQSSPRRFFLTLLIFCALLFIVTAAFPVFAGSCDDVRDNLNGILLLCRARDRQAAEIGCCI